MSETKNYIEAFSAIMSPPDIRDWRISKRCLAADFPESFELTMPSVKNQGSVGSCVAHSITTFAEYYNIKQHNIATPLSVGYVYGNRGVLMGNNQGMITRLAIANFCSDGTPFNDDFPDHYEVPEIIDKVKSVKDSLHDAATQFRFTAYLRTDSEEEMKTALMNGNPIIIAVDWQKDMCYRDGKFFSTFLAGKSGGHAMVIYGWDKDGWKVQNSWGIGWGNKGTAIWPYLYKIREKYAIIDTLDTALVIDKPFKTTNAFGRFWVKVANIAYALWYNIKHKLSK